MRVTRATLIVAGLLYVTLWVIAFNGATELSCHWSFRWHLVLMIVLGVALQRYMGIAPRRSKFDDSKDEREAVNEIHDDAVVLRTFKSGEADRVVVLWTRHFGKVRVLAKGARKSTSRLGATLETLAYVKVDLVKTRGEFYIAASRRAHRAPRQPAWLVLRGSRRGTRSWRRWTRSPPTAWPTKRSSIS